MQAVILAGGLGTRMYPRTFNTPKALLEVAGRPFIDWQLSALAARGFEDVVLCIGHLGDQIREHVGTGSTFGLKVHYSDESPNHLGTAGALYRAQDLFAPTFLVTYGDTYLPFDCAQALRRLEWDCDLPGVMTVCPSSAGNIALEGDWVTAHLADDASPEFEYLDCGAIALRHVVIREMDPRFFGAMALPMLTNMLAVDHMLRAIVVDEPHFEIGSPEGLARFERWLRSEGDAA